MISDNLKIDNELLKSLSDEEKQYALRILEEISTQGKSRTLDDIRYSDYKEIPVDIITFIKDPRYLGAAWHTATGDCKLFPYWEKVLKQIFPDNITTSVNNLIESGARGLGKSEIAVTISLYLMHRIMCLKDPRTFYDVKPTEQIAFAFMNITEALSYEIGVTKFQNTVQMSPWFMERGTITGRQVKIWNPPEFIHIIVGSRPSHVIGQAIFFAFFDEISFIQNQDIEKQKEKAIDMIDTAIGGMKTRFIKQGKNPTLLCLASSKRSDKSFLEVHTKKKLESEKENVIVVDEPVWNVRPADEYCGKKFYVAQGNKYLASEIVPKGADLKPYRDKGYTLIEVPIEFYADFYENIDRALCDFAGVSSSDVTKYIAGFRLQAVKSQEIKNPFSKDIIEVGNAPDDKVQYYDFFDMSKVDSSMKSKPLYIHLDMSLSGDRTGIAGVWIKGKRPPKDGETSSKDLYYQLAFSIAVKAPRGYQVSFEKNRQFIYWLKENGFRIKGVSSDTYQSADLKQQLIAKGYKYDIISVDRVDTLDDGKTKLCKPYHYFRNTIYEERILMYDSELLTTELLGLEKNSAGRVDHPDSGTTGCFTGETKVRLVDGRTLSFLELVKEFEEGKVNYVYSFNHKLNIIEPKRVEKAWCTLRDQPLIRVTLDNGEFVDCTYNHKFMLRDGTYKEAQYLTTEDSLMPLYTRFPSEGLKDYRMYYEPIENRWHYEHRRFVVDILDGKDVVHHKNCNPHDNTPDNLVYVTRGTHQQIHAQIQTGAQSPDAKRKRSESIRRWHQENKDTDAYRLRSEKCRISTLSKTSDEERQHRLEEEARRKAIIKEKRKIAEQKKADRDYRIKEIERIFNVKYSELSTSQRNSYGVKYARMMHPEIQERISRAVSENHKKGKYQKAHEALEAYNESQKGKTRPKEVIDKMIQTRALNAKPVSEERRKQLSTYSSNCKWYNDGEIEKFISIDKPVPDGFKPGRINHKVVSIEYLEKTADVYDITVEDNHNFALDAGVFVHNSKDCSDAVCGALWNASQHADEFEFDYGESLNDFVNVNTEKSSLDERQQMIVDFQEELRKVFGSTHPRPENGPKEKNEYSIYAALQDGIII